MSAATHLHLPSDSRFGPASLQDLLPAQIPTHDPVARLLDEERRDNLMLRGVLVGAVAVFALALFSTWLG